MPIWRARSRPGRIVFRLALAALLVSASNAWPQPVRRAFDIPAGAMSEALNLFARQAGVRLLFPYDLVSGKRTPAVRGQMASEEALGRLLKETGVEVADRQDNVIVLRAAGIGPRSPPPAPKAEPPPPSAYLDELVVAGQVRFGRNQLRIGATETATASVSGFGQALVQSMAIANPADLFRVLPGFQVSDFGQGPVAQGVALRGWTTTSDGQDLAFFVDGAPRNQVSGANSNGYLDINPLIADTIEEVTVVRGPFDIRYGGNLALGASVVVETRTAIPSGARLSANGFGGVQGLAVSQLDLGPAAGYLVVNAARLSGYRDNSTGNALNLYARVAAPMPGGDGMFSLQGYRTRFGKPAYLRLSELDAGRAQPTDAIDDDDFSRKDQVTGLFHYDGQVGRTLLDAHAFVDRSMISSATNYGGQPTRVPPYPEYIYRDNRWVVGGDFEARQPFSLGEMGGEARVGGLVRTDFVRSLRAPGFGGVARLDPSPLDALFFARGDFTQTNLAAYAALDLKPTPALKLSAGVRRDVFLYDFDNALFNATTASRRSLRGSATPGATTVKLGAALELGDAVTLVANYGESLRAPSALTDIPVNTGFKIARLRSREVGLAYSAPGGRLRANLNAFKTELSNEIAYANFLPVNDGPSRRSGVDASIDAKLIDRGAYKLAAAVNYSSIDARLVDNPLGTHVRQVAEWQAGYTLEATLPGFGSQGDFVTARLDHAWIGPQPLTIRGDVRTSAYDRVAAKVAYHLPRSNNLVIWVSAIAYPHNRVSETSYVFLGERFVSPMAPLRLETGAALGF